MLRRLFTLAALSSISGVWAQSSSALSGPGEGFVFDAPTKSIRPVTGSLGSAMMGPAVLEKVTAAFVAPHQDYALVVHHGRLILFSSLSSAPQPTALLLDPAPLFDGVIWSGDGSGAIVYSRAGNWIQTFTGMPASLVKGDKVSLSSLGGAISAIAVDSHASQIALGMTGDHAGVYQITAGQQPSRLLDLAQPIGLAFSDDDATLYALDAATNAVSVLNLTGSAVQSFALQIDDAVAVRPSRDVTGRNVLYVAGRSSRSLAVYDAATMETITTSSLSFEPSAIEPLGDSGFLLSHRKAPDEPLWTFTNSTPPNVYFVPAALNQSTQSTEGAVK